MDDLIRPNSWIALKLPSETVRVLQVAPNTTISLGKYGSFPSNLIIGRPYHITWELLDKRDDETFCRLRVVPAAELYADLYSETSSDATASPAPDGGDDVDPDAEAADKEIKAAAAAVESSARARSCAGNMENDPARQTLSMGEIEVLKKEGARAGRELIAKLIDSHTAIEEKTAFSLAKYRLLKTKKYIRRFSVMPFDVARMAGWLLEDKDASKILDMREEMMALVGCWGNVHYGGDLPEGWKPVVLDPETGESVREGGEVEEEGEGDGGVENDAAGDGGRGRDPLQVDSPTQEPLTGRWLVVDDTGGLLTAAMAERMGLLYEHKEQCDESARLLNAFGQRARKYSTDAPQASIPAKRGAEEPVPNTQQEDTKEQSTSASELAPKTAEDADGDAAMTTTAADKTPVPQPTPQSSKPAPTKPQYRSDFEIPLAPSNTLTILHQNGQPNLSYLKYWDFDSTSPNPHRSAHPLASHLLSLTWLQLLDPESDLTYSTPPPTVDPGVLASWKASRRGNYHRKRRRWARTRYTVSATRRGGHSGLVVASSMDPMSILLHTLPLLAGGAPVAVYAPHVETLVKVADCFSAARRSAWASAPPEGARGLGRRELERWSCEEFPMNPSLLLGVGVQTARVRRWQVHPGRTHPLMTSRGGAEGWVLTGYKAVPVEGRIAARGKFKKRRVD